MKDSNDSTVVFQENDLKGFQRNEITIKVPLVLQRKMSEGLFYFIFCFKMPKK